MKRIITLGVALRDLSTFQFSRGAEAFIKEYEAFQVDFFYFNFNIEQDEWKTAEERLKELDLKYRAYYKIELQDDEIKNYPVFNLTIPALFGLVATSSGNEVSISKRELGDLLLAEDFDSKLLVFSDSVWKVLQEFSAAPDLYHGKALFLKKNKYFLSRLPIVSEIPLIVLNAESIKEETGGPEVTYYPDGLDERFDIALEGISFVQKYHFISAYNFEYKHQLYSKKAPNFLISGKLAFALHSLSKGAIQMTPLTLKQI